MQGLTPCDPALPRAVQGLGTEGHCVLLTAGPMSPSGSGADGAGWGSGRRWPAVLGPGGTPAEARHRGPVLYEHLLPLPAGELLQLDGVLRP